MAHGSYYVAKVNGGARLGNVGGDIGIWGRRPKRAQVSGKVYGPFKSHIEAEAMQAHLRSGGRGFNPAAVVRRAMHHRSRDRVPYTLWTYDVWGNEKDGYTVNDRYKQGKVYLPKDASSEEIIRALRKDGWIDKRLRRNLLEIEGERDYTIYITYKGRPEMELEKERD